MARFRNSDHAARLKADVALAAVRGDRSLSELATEFGLDPDQIVRWRRKLEQNADLLFRAGQPGAPPVPHAAIERATAPVSQAPAARSGVPSSAAIPMSAAQALPRRPSPATDPPPIRDSRLAAGNACFPAARKQCGPGRTAMPPPLLTPRAWWPRRLIGSMVKDWRERRHAAAVSRRLVSLYRMRVEVRPDVPKQELYRKVVSDYLACSEPAAEAVLELAHQSFAAWPVPRPLRLQDVALYLAISDLLSSKKDGLAFVGEGVRRVIVSKIARHL